MKKINIYYEYNSADLSPESLPSLYKLAGFLSVNKDVNIEITAHTDSRGSANYNLNLSQERAENVVLFLYFDEDIDRKRMNSIGYGETKLTNKCKDNVKCSEEEHSQNRRTEVRITSINKLSK